MVSQNNLERFIMFQKVPESNRTPEVYRASLLVPHTAEDLARIKKVGMYLDSFYTNVLYALGIILTHEGVDGEDNIYTVRDITTNDLRGITQSVTDMIEINEEFVDFCIETRFHDIDREYLHERMCYDQKSGLMMSIFIEQYIMLSPAYEDED